ncbi:phage portal protein [Sphingomonas sp. MMS24-J13]|uniref:phage portal protein n=1 Tax=Sphingomonas sp. MMS24-J13 TaxID=3238686 RepID=UPI00384B2AD6
MSVVSVITGWITGSTSYSPAKMDGPKSIAWGDGNTYARKRVTPESALSLSTAWACTRLNSRTVGALPRKLMRRSAGGEQQPAEDHPLSLLLDNPNPDQTAMEFWEGQAVALNLRGNAYARIGRRGDGQPVALWPMPPDVTRVYRTDAGERRYMHWNGGSTEDLPESEVFHLRGFGAGGDMGLSPISFGRQTIATALAMEEVAGGTFGNGLQLSGFVEDQPGARTTQTQREDLVALFQKFAGSGQTGKVMPLPPGMAFKALGLSPEDAQLLESRRFSVEEICRWFGTFPILIGHASQGQTMWGTGIEQIMLAWLTLGLGTELERIEQAFQKQLLLPKDRGLYKVETSVEGLLRADSAGRAALYSALGQNGVMKRNEMRAKENLPRDASPGADKLTVQSNLISLDQLGAAPPAADQARSALMNLLFGGDIDAMIDARVKSLIGHNGGPRLED